MQLNKQQIETLLTQNQNLIRFMVVSKFHIRPEDHRYEDCMQEGYCAAWKALSTFNFDTSNFTVSTIITKAVHDALYFYISRDSSVVLSHRAIIQRTQLNRKLQSVGLTPAEEKILNNLNSVAFGSVSYDAPISDDSDDCDNCLDSLIGFCDADVSERETLKEILLTYINSLQDNHKKILTCYLKSVTHGEKPGITVMAKEFGVSKQYVSQVVNSHLATLRKKLVRCGYTA